VRTDAAPSTDANADAGEGGGRRRRGRRGGRRRRRGQAGAEGEVANDAMAQDHEHDHDDMESGEVAAQHRSQPEFDFDDDGAPLVATSEPAPTQPAEAAAAPRQAAAHDAAFAAAPMEHDVERTPSGPETNVESASTGYDADAVTSPGTWTASPVANESARIDAASVEPDAIEPASVETASVEPASVEPGAAEPANVPVEAAPVEAASVEATSVESTAVAPAPVEAAVAATPDTIAMPSRERDVDAAPESEVSYIDPRQPSPGLFDAMPEDPAQIAADAAESSQEQAENRNA
jgi:ribonuclease E